MSPRARLRAPLLVALLLVLVGAGARWWQVDQRQRWLEHATLEELSAAAHRDESDIAVFHRLGIRAREAEQWGRAAKAFQHAAELGPDRVENWVGWARAIYEIDGFLTADLILSDYLRRHPDDATAYTERAALRRNARHRAMALADVIKATDLAPDSGQAWALRGDLSLDQGLAGEAEIAFKRARKLMPTSPWPYIGLYQAYIQLKKLPEALETAHLILEKFPSIPEANLYLGEALVQMVARPEDNETARRTLEQAARRAEELRPADRFALEFLMGRTYANQSRWREALPHLERARRISGDNPEMLFLLGRVYRALGNEAQAEATLKAHRRAYEDRAFVRRTRARIDQAPDDPAPRLEMARWFVGRGALGSAAVEYEEMIARGVATETARRELRSLEERGALP